MRLENHELPDPRMVTDVDKVDQVTRWPPVTLGTFHALQPRSASSGGTLLSWVTSAEKQLISTSPLISLSKNMSDYQVLTSYLFLLRSY